MCDAGALYFDPTTRRVEYNRERYRDRGTGANCCGPAAVMQAPTAEERQQLRAMVQG